VGIPIYSDSFAINAMELVEGLTGSMFSSGAWSGIHSPFNQILTVSTLLTMPRRNFF
jgi:hypothetical protein